ncbi:Na+/H+ antiporter subunit E [Clostridium cochlearium]|uniref:Na+/H+ antiporter subunit E n=1 Tax=Clostridium cochlearium TaxID=1494 RepID=UPI001677D79F|nr:Na+/H+ antiporter subunit E [Clostridium cochlearium]
MKILTIHLYLIFWLILAQRFTLETIILGYVISYCVFKFNEEMLCININFKKCKYILIYCFCLVKEVFKANFHVAKIILSPKMNISPRVVSFETKIKSNFLRTVLANSITLTPGTLTVNVQDNIFTVHCLEESNIEDLKDSNFEKILLKFEESKDDESES